MTDIGRPKSAAGLVFAFAAAACKLLDLLIQQVLMAVSTCLAIYGLPRKVWLTATGKNRVIK